MPHIPDSRHADHDPLLVAAYAAGDATGSQLDDAIATVAACAECAALHHDLRAISAALPTLPAPARPRDFRLTPEQAATLRPAGWRRLLAPFAGPRFAFAGPLGTGLATLGIAGLLVAGSIGAPIAATAPQDGGGNASASGPVENLTGGAMPEEPATGAPYQAPESLESMAPPVPGGQGGDIRTTGVDPSAAPSGDGGETALDPQLQLSMGPDEAVGATPEADTFATAVTAAPDPAYSPVLGVAALLLAAGLVLGGLRLLARRVA